MAQHNIQNLPEQVDELIFYLDDKKGRLLFEELKSSDKGDIWSDPELRGIFISLQFLIIPHLSTAEISDLLRENLFVGLHIEDMDIVERINKKLLFMHLADRDNCKNELKNALVNNKEQLTEITDGDNNKKLDTTKDWLLDYIAGTEKQKGKLGQAQYLFQKPHFLNLEDDDKEVLKKLFALYKFLNTSSMTPEGFEDDMLVINEDGKLITTNKGKIVELYDTKKGQGPKKVGPKARQVSGPPKTEEEKEIDELKQEETKYKAGGLEQLALEEEVGKKKQIEELEIMAKKYKNDSLEKKALLEEIEKIKKR